MVFFFLVVVVVVGFVMRLWVDWWWVRPLFSLRVVSVWRGRLVGWLVVVIGACLLAVCW